MKKVYGSHDSILVAQLRQVLEANHIACITRNDFLSGAAGELPPTECWPEIWVVEDFQEDRARDLVRGFMDAVTSRAREAPQAWICAGCGEEAETPFTQCWRCGRERPPWEA